MSQYQSKLGSNERRAGSALALIYAFRMLGLFLILPVFAIYAEKLPDSTPLLTGLALGAYGLTQAILQIPFGRLSDRIGRKPVIAFGLVIFALGSLLAASAHSIVIIILGRALQGSGAVAAALLALAADLSREEHRTKMMATIGTSIGMAFAIAMVAAPTLNHMMGVPGIFALTAVLAILGIVILYTMVPNPVVTKFHRDAEVDSSSIGKVLKNLDLLRLDSGIFILHFSLMCSFLVMPLMLRDMAHLKLAEHWKVYLPVFVVSLVIMVPFIIIGEKKQKLREVFIGAVALLAGALWVMATSSGEVELIGGMVMFFIAFNLLEASLPSLISKTADASQKGTAMGIYSSSQFLGAFCGGLAGGFAHGHWGVQGALYTAMGAALVWLLIAATMKKPRQLSTYLLNLGGNTGISEEQLLAIPGVAEAAIIVEDGIAYLKVEKHILDEEKLLSFAGAN
jgi:MFS family permease